MIQRMAIVVLLALMNLTQAEAQKTQNIRDYYVGIGPGVMFTPSLTENNQNWPGLNLEFGWLNQNDTLTSYPFFHLNWAGLGTRQTRYVLEELDTTSSKQMDAFGRASHTFLNLEAGIKGDFVMAWKKNSVRSFIGIGLGMMYFSQTVTEVPTVPVGYYIEQFVSDEKDHISLNAMMNLELQYMIGKEQAISLGVKGRLTILDIAEGRSPSGPVLFDYGDVGLYLLYRRFF